MRRHHQRLVGYAIRLEGESDARPPDPRDARVDLDLVVEARRREVLDVVRAHDEVAGPVLVQQPERAQVLDAREVEVRVVPPVVDDPLRVGVGECDARLRR